MPSSILNILKITCSTEIKTTLTESLIILGHVLCDAPRRLDSMRATEEDRDVKRTSSFIKVYLKLA
jgi:hypothetical protein